jgi:HD domain
VIHTSATFRDLVASLARSESAKQLQAANDGFTPDAELFYVAAMLHDLGLAGPYDRGQCFEVDGASAARAILAALGWPGEKATRVGDAIYLHMHDVSEEDTAEARALALGTTADVSGGRALEITERSRDLVLGLFPRLGFKREFSALFEDQARRKPWCSVHAYMAAGLGDRIMSAPYDE